MLLLSLWAPGLLLCFPASTVGIDNVALILRHFLLSHRLGVVHHRDLAAFLHIELLVVFNLLLLMGWWLIQVYYDELWFYPVLGLTSCNIYNLKHF